MIPYILTALGGYLIGSSVKQYASGGQVQLLAPNGKPSNLSPEQYKLVRTPEFKAWFGDWENDPENASKVVDENLEPMVVYHGTKADFSTFKSDFLIWVTSDFDYVKERIENEGRFNKHFELFCKSKNYLDLSSIGYKGISGKDFYEEIKNKYGVEIIELLSNENDFRRPYAFINTYSRANFLKKYGFDGFKIAIDNKNYGIAVFNPEQVKLADGSNTTFDGSNPDIRYKDGGEIANKEIEKIAKESVLKIGEPFDENDYIGQCKEISEEVAYQLNKVGIETIPMRIIYGRDTKYNSKVSNHAYSFLPETNQIVDTQLWQLEGKPNDLSQRKVLYSFEEYNKIVELYDVEPIEDWENRYANYI